MLPFLWRTPMSKRLVEQQPLRRVGVRVDDDRAIVQLLRLRRDRRGGCLRRDVTDSGKHRECEQSSVQTDADHGSSGRA